MKVKPTARTRALSIQETYPDHRKPDASSRPAATHMSTTRVPSPVVSVTVLSPSDTDVSDAEDLFYLCKSTRRNTGKISCAIYAQDGNSLYTYKGTVNPSTRSKVIESKIFPDSTKYMETSPTEQWKLASTRATVVTHTGRARKLAPPQRSHVLAVLSILFPAGGLPSAHSSNINRHIVAVK